MTNSSTGGTTREPVTVTGARMAGNEAVHDVLRLLQLNVHTLLLQLALMGFGQRGGSPEQTGAKEEVAEKLVSKGED